MSKSFNQVYVHIIFHVGNGVFIRSDNEAELYSYISGISKNLFCHIMAINGTGNHIHLLVSLSQKISVADFVSKVKSNSSKWMKKYDDKFSWQRGYGAFSVSASVCQKVKRYIEKQKAHHEKISYQDELQSFLDNYHFS